MRILLTTDTLGGVWTFTRELCGGLLHLGHDVALVSLGRAPSEGQCAWCTATSLAFGRQFRYEALEAPLEWMESNVEAYRGPGSFLLHIAESFHADLIHSSQFCFGALPAGVPRIITAHSDCFSWAEACRPEGLEETSWLRCYRALVTDGLEGAAAVVAPTRWMADALLRGFPAVSDVRVIANGRTLAGCGPAPERLPQAVSIGRMWDEAKQAGLLLGLGSTMPVILAGEDQLCNQSSEGALCEEDVLSLFRSSSVYIAAAIYEPFGLAPLEAALCGCAVAANDIPSLREVWGDAALYFTGRESLKTLLNNLLAKPDELRLAQQRSHKRALQLSAEAMVDQYLSLYVELLGSSSPTWSEQGTYA